MPCADARKTFAASFLFVAAAAALGAADRPITLSHAGCAAPGDPVDPALLERPTALKSDIGRVHQKVTTASADAQRYYDQGLTNLHHYVFIEAARSFHQSLRSDPGCAMCWNVSAWPIWRASNRTTRAHQWRSSSRCPMAIAVRWRERSC